MLNKSDLLGPEAARKKLDDIAEVFGFSALRSVSSMTGDGIEELVSFLKSRLSEGPRYFPEDMITDLSERFLVGEIIREKVFNMTRQEIPYSTAVEIEKFIEEDPVTIYAAIHIEKDSQKGIVLGRNGAMIKEIGIEARRDIERLIGAHVVLKLIVKVTKDWSKDARELKRLGYK